MQLSLTTSKIDYSSTVCRPVTMTCMTVNLQSLNWYFDDFIAGSFVHSPTARLPENIYNANGLSIDVIAAALRSSRSDDFNSTSVLTGTTLALTLLGVDLIECGINSLRRPVTGLTRLNVRGKWVCCYYVHSYMRVHADRKQANLQWRKRIR